MTFSPPTLVAAPDADSYRRMEYCGIPVDQIHLPHPVVFTKGTPLTAHTSVALITAIEPFLGEENWVAFRNMIEVEFNKAQVGKDDNAKRLLVTRSADLSAPNVIDIVTYWAMANPRTAAPFLGGEDTIDTIVEIIIFDSVGTG